MNEVQRIILSIFDEVSSICNENHIPYYAIGGTCIGAIRHKGFIPWDDDLDIAVPIEYYDKLLSLLSKDLHEPLYVYSSKEVKHYKYIWAKVCNRETSFIEKVDYPYKDAYKGIFVDIMPISGVPRSPFLRFIFRTKLKILHSLNKIVRFESSVGGRKSKIISIISKTLLRLYPFYHFSESYFKLINRYPIYKSDFTGYVWSAQSIDRLVFPTSFFGEGIEMQFEDTKIHMPSEYHSYLSFQFGNYLELPPVEKRAIHDGIVDTDKSFVYYYDAL